MSEGRESARNTQTNVKTSFAAAHVPIGDHADDSRGCGFFSIVGPSTARLFDRVRLERKQKRPRIPEICFSEVRFALPFVCGARDLSSEPVVFAVVGVFPVNGNC